MQVRHCELLRLATQRHCCLASGLDGCLSCRGQPGCFSLCLCCNSANERALLAGNEQHDIHLVFPDNARRPTHHCSVCDLCLCHQAHAPSITFLRWHRAPLCGVSCPAQARSFTLCLLHFVKVLGCLL